MLDQLPTTVVVKQILLLHVSLFKSGVFHKCFWVHLLLPPHVLIQVPLISQIEFYNDLKLLLLPLVPSFGYCLLCCLQNKLCKVDAWS